MFPVPFSKIAISLSGGGYRATTFHLGALSLLNALDFGEERLLKEVKIVSTISGGTLTGVMYAQMLAEGKAFGDCFDKLYFLLEEDKLVARALQKLNNPKKWTNKHKSRDVINAFSEVYDEHFYDRGTFAALYDNKEGHLTDAIFGASEFTTGIQFRFQHGHEDERFGNGNLSLPLEVAREIRLADAAAASSCFPGGFEPMIMPKDFGNGPDSAVDISWSQTEHEPTTAIMDGGILDNQGIEGVKLAERRHIKDGLSPIGTYIISDVAGENMEPFVVPKMKENWFLNLFTFRRINVLALLSLIGLAASIYFFDLPVWAIILNSGVLTLILLWAATYFIAQHFFYKEVENTFAGAQLPEILQDFKVITRTPVYIVAYLVRFRAMSAAKMVMDIFLRRIRRLQLNALYASPKWNGRIKDNNIYALSHKSTAEIGFRMTEVVNNANTMPTSLWFTEEQKANHMLDDLIACGQFTLCYNLLEYCKELQTKEFQGQNVWEKTPQEQQQRIEALEKQLEDYWKQFMIDPYWLLNEEKKVDVARTQVAV
jgi:predicted acylesterase/phospholipase RssA